MKQFMPPLQPNFLAQMALHQGCEFFPWGYKIRKKSEADELGRTWMSVRLFVVQDCDTPDETNLFDTNGTSYMFW